MTQVKLTAQDHTVSGERTSELCCWTRNIVDTTVESSLKINQTYAKYEKKTKYYRRFDSVLQVRMQYTTKKQVWFDHHVDYCSKILCIYIYIYII